tara:strand:+ start:76 stop:579 length:504 start_codon:yes stop_codon:yes gene_type:complete
MTELRPVVSMESLGKKANKNGEQLAIPKIALILSYCGLIPFIALSVGLWFSPANQTEFLNNALITYSAIILSFIGAIYWGFCMSKNQKNKKKFYIFSVLPALFGWLILLSDTFLNYFLFSMAFGCVCLFDVAQSKKGELPAWYPKLRVPVTILVITSLTNAQIFFII